MRRREALKTMGGLAGAAALSKVLPGCGSDDGPVGITTVVCMMMENRSYDHLLGARSLLEGKPGDGLTAAMFNNDPSGNPIAPFAVGSSDSVCIVDPPHDWDPCHMAWNSGANDGFVAAYDAAYPGMDLTGVMGYLTRDHEPATWALADAYTSCDRWFSSVMGPTLPNRFYWYSGTSKGHQDNGVPTTTELDTWQTLYHRLDAKQVSWGYYYGDLPIVANIPKESGIDVTPNVFRMEDFFNQAKQGKLPSVCYIDPSFSSNDDHPPHHTMLGQQLIASVYTALATSPQWKNVLFVLTYDEHGGYFDHVSPPNMADDYASLGFGLPAGFRVPALVMGPYTKQGQVVSTVYDHTSMLKYLENLFELDPLTMRSTAATPIDDCIDQDLLAKGTPNEPAMIPAITVNESDITANCMKQKETAHVVLDWADQRPDIFGRFDRRAYTRDYLYMIGDYLEANNMGRIIRGK